MAWNPTRYLRFEEVRLRPALELLSRAVSMVGAQPVARVVDMGCGPGNVVPFLQQACSRYTACRVSDRTRPGQRHILNAWIARPRCLRPHDGRLGRTRAGCRTQSAISKGWPVGVLGVTTCHHSYTSSAELDVIYANASLHWVADHGAVLPRLVGMLRPGGVLAFQVGQSNFYVCAGSSNRMVACVVTPYRFPTRGCSPATCSCARQPWI